MRTGRFAAVLLFLLSCTGKGKPASEPPEGAAPKAPAPTSSSHPAARTESSRASRPVPATPEDGCQLQVRALRRQSKGRIVALGDVHGDLAATRRALRLAKLTDDEDRWIGGETTLVQTGDMLDRGDEERAIMDMMFRLRDEAAAAGGQVVLLNGNHEFMNAMGDFRYVTRAGFADFAGLDGEPIPEPMTAEPRARALFPGGRYALKLADSDMVAVVDDSVFVHGGVLERFASGLERENRDSRCFLTGEHPKPPSSVLDPEGPLWTRAFSSPEIDCKALEASLEAIGVTRMVVGHTPQLRGITQACEGKVWRVDTGMAAYYGGPTQALLIEKDRVTVLE